MLERVARAIADANMEDFDELPSLHMEMARAAIAVMREPTGEMVDAGFGTEGRRFGRERWQAMINEALKDTA